MTEWIEWHGGKCPVNYTAKVEVRFRGTPDMWQAGEAGRLFWEHYDGGRGEIIAYRVIEDEKQDVINHPPHYTSHPSGVECIQITEHMSFCLGNAIKYIWRAGLKSDDALEDLKKARFYIDREIKRMEK